MRSIIVSLLAIFAILPVKAQNGLIASSIDPEKDSLYIATVRKHLDSVRNTQGRPTVALVLSGGGAKGAAEVGAMQVLDSLGIPIDFICGTSVGSLIGGFYALGYDVDYIGNTFKSIDWNKMMSDNVEPKYYPLHEKKYKSNYLISVPFSYDSEGLHGELLPSGYVSGLHINNLFSSISVGYHDSLSFSSLPVPFACVAAEVVQQKAVHFTGGILKTAMRSSMSIPGVFTPVNDGGMMVVDGGIRNNFPTDIAKAVGADIIIGIDMLPELRGYDRVNNVGTILNQMILMLTAANQDLKRSYADVVIRPVVVGFNALSFTSEAVEELYTRGHLAAMESIDQLMLIAERTNHAGSTYINRRAVDLNKTSVQLRSIMFKGMTNEESRLLHQVTAIDIKKKVDANDLEKAISLAKASGAVESIVYSLYGDSEPYDLVFDCVPSQPHRLGVGVRMDSEVWAEIGVNFGVNVNKIAGPKFDIDFKLGKSQSIGAKMMLDYPSIPTINLETRFSNTVGHIEPLGRGQNLKLETAYISQEEKLYLSSRRLRAFELKAGLRHSYFKMRESLAGSLFSNLPKELMSGGYFGTFAKVESYTFDNMYFPNKGIMFLLGGNMDFGKVGIPDFQPKYYSNMDVKFVLPMGKRIALIPDIHYRMLFDKDVKVLTPSGETNKSYSYYHRNFIGGDVPGRYLEHQMPFIGFNNATDCISLRYDENGNIIGSVAYDHAAVVNLDFRASLGKNFYFSALAGFVHMAPDFSNFIRFNDHLDIKAAGLQLSYNARTGPVKFRVQWCDRGTDSPNRSGAYISAGYNF